MKGRIKKIFSNSGKEVDAILIGNGQHPNVDLNFFYTSGITSGAFEGCLIVAKSNGKGYLLTSELEELIARKETKLGVIVFKNKEERELHLKELLSDVNTLGINSNSLSYKQYSDISKFTKAKITDISDAFSKTRSIKDKEEIKLISKACKISAISAEEFVGYLKEPNVTEEMLSSRLVGRQYNNGATNLA
ncbi:MAG: aminopeptidase P family N-terminal domain-containing protein, partial [Candidatus Aenigmatarchaeota archaeon]